MKHLLILLLVFMVSGSYAADYHDYESGTQTLNFELERELRFEVNGPAFANLGFLSIYALIPRLDIDDEWGIFQTVDGVSFTADPPVAYYENYENQWLLVQADLSNQTLPFTQKITWHSTGTRKQQLNGIDDDFMVEPGAYYTSFTSGIPEVTALSQFAAYAVANPIAGMVTGYVGVAQRGAAKIQADYPGNCNSMTKNEIAMMRSLDIPACFVPGVEIEGSVTISLGFGSTMTRTFSNNGGVTGHCQTGIWCDAERAWLPSDRANESSNLQFLQFVALGYFEDPGDAGNYVYISGPDSRLVSVTGSQVYTKVSSTNESQSYSYVTKRPSGEFAFEKVLCQKPAGTFKGGQLFEPPTSTVSVGNDQPGKVKMLAAFPNPVRQGQRLYMAIGKPTEPTWAKVRLYDITGRQVPNWGVDYQCLDKADEHYVDLPTNLAAGVYTARLTTGTGQEAEWKFALIK